MEAYGLDAYSPSLQTKKSLFYKNGLSAEQHTIKIVVTGEKNPNATDSHVTVDVFEVDGSANIPTDEHGIKIYNDNDPNVDYYGSWSYYTDPVFYNNDEHFSNQTGAYAEFIFTGTSVSYIAATSYNLGMCNIYIDGTLAQYGVDAYSPELEPQKVLFYQDGLSAGQHTIKIVVTGEKNPNATDSYVTIDAFEVSYETPTEPVDPDDDIKPGFKNLALGQTVHVTSAANNNRGGDKVIDGDTTTSWLAKNLVIDELEFLIIAFDAPVAFNQIKITELGSRISGWKLQHSNNLMSTPTLANGTALGNYIYNGSEITAKFIILKITGLKSNATAAAGIIEIEVYNTNS